MQIHKIPVVELEGRHHQAKIWSVLYNFVTVGYGLNYLSICIYLFIFFKDLFISKDRNKHQDKYLSGSKNHFGEEKPLMFIFCLLLTRNAIASISFHTTASSLVVLAK